jgi:hypothetical protein
MLKKGRGKFYEGSQAIYLIKDILLIRLIKINNRLIKINNPI